MESLLCNQEVSFLVLEELKELENIRVVELAEDGDLIEQFFLLRLLQGLLVYDLYRSQLLRLLMLALPHLSIRTYTLKLTLRSIKLSCKNLPLPMQEVIL